MPLIAPDWLKALIINIKSLTFVQLDDRQMAGKPQMAFNRIPDGGYLAQKEEAQAVHEHTQTLHRKGHA
jgi:hypothetical protein